MDEWLKGYLTGVVVTLLPSVVCVLFIIESMKI